MKTELSALKMRLSILLACFMLPVKLQLIAPNNVQPISLCSFERENSCSFWMNSPNNPFSFMVSKENLRLGLDDRTTSQISYLSTPKGSKGSTSLISQSMSFKSICLSFIFAISGNNTKLSIYERSSLISRRNLVWQAGLKKQWMIQAIQINSNRTFILELSAETSGGTSSVSIDDITIQPSTCTVLDGDAPRNLANYTISSAAVSQLKNWDNAMISYVILPGFDEAEISLIKRMMKDLESRTCITFKPKLETDQDYIEFVNLGFGCSSDLGRVGGKQTVKLADKCFTPAVIAHMLLHVIGLRHEHVRPDRDEFVKVIAENIKSGAEDSFRIVRFIPAFMNVPYDPNSVMHFKNNELARSPDVNVLEDKEDPELQLGPQDDEGPKVSDYQKVANLYCNGKLKTLRESTTTPVITTTTVNPTDSVPCRNLSTISLSSKVVISNYLKADGLYRSNERCGWLVRSSNTRSSIRVNVDLMDLEWSNRCAKDSITIYDGPNNDSSPLFQGCGGKRIAGNIISSSNSIFLEFKTDGFIAGSGFVVTLEESDQLPQTAPLDCGFEETSCGWMNQRANSLLWKRKKIPSLVEDHTTQSSDGSYIAVDASSFGARSQSASLSSRRFLTADNFKCLWLWFRFVDASSNRNIGKLEVWLSTDSSSDLLLWSSARTSLEGSAYSNWTGIQIPLDISDTLIYTLGITATLNFKMESSGIAVDDIGISQIPCDSFKSPETTTNATSQNQSCSFDDGGICLWRVQTGNGAVLALKTGPSSPSTSFGAVSDHTKPDGRGYYLLAVQSRIGIRANGAMAVLETSIPAGKGYRCLEFYYNMNGPKVGLLRVKTVANNLESLLHLSIGNQGNGWQRGLVSLAGTVEAYTIRFEALLTGFPDSDIAIDDVSLLSNDCMPRLSQNVPKNPASPPSTFLDEFFCDFEDGDLCQETLQFTVPVRNGTFRWFDPQSLNVIADRTLNSKEGHVAMATGGSFGSQTVLQSQHFIFANISCLSFWYFIGNSTPNDANLTVIQTTNINREIQLLEVRTQSRTFKNRWIFANFRLEGSNRNSLKFIARSSGSGTLFALDDIKLAMGNRCNVERSQLTADNFGWDCNFDERNLCSWSPVGAWSFTQTSNGYFIRSSSASLVSPMLGYNSATSKWCFSLKYRTISSSGLNATLNKFNISVLNRNNQKRAIASATVDGIDSTWMSLNLSILEDDSYRLALETNGSTRFNISVAFDDFSLRPGECLSI